MPDKSKFNIDYRPETYWDDAVRMLLANIKGEHRRRTVLDLVGAGRVEALEKWIIAEKLSDEVRELVGKIHPVFMGGEYLPDSAEGEVEIARVVLRSTTADIICIRAKRDTDTIEYQVVDEYDSAFNYAPRNSKEPLTFSELISLIDSVEDEGSGRSKGLTNSFRDWNGQADFVTVTSSFYPELENWYRDEANEWLREQSKNESATGESLAATSTKARTIDDVFAILSKSIDLMSPEEKASVREALDKKLPSKPKRD
jgi:hypothetical protein